MQSQKPHLLIGRTGFLGSSFALLAQQNPVEARGHLKRSIGLFVPVTRDIFDFTKPNDIVKLDKLATETGAKAAIITASVASPDEALKNPELSHAVNVTGTIKLFEYLKEKGVKPVFYSTDHVYDGQKGAYDETDAYCPVTLYGRQKVQAEEFLKAKFDDYLILRTSKQVATRIDKKNILSEMVLKLIAGEKIKCATDHWIAPSFVEDIVPMTYRAIEAGLKGPYHVAPEQTYTRIEIGNLIAGIMDETFKPKTSYKESVTPCSIRDFSFLEIRPPRCTLNGNKLRQALNYKMILLESGIRELLASMQGQQSQLLSHQ